MISELIENDKIKISFQPIISIKDKKIFAMEALTRAYDKYDQPMSPEFLFKQAREEKLSCVLDDYVRSLAILKFKEYIKADNSLLLFLNFESQIIDNDKSFNFQELVLEHEINPNNIVIEIKEDKIKNSHLLHQFVQKHRAYGFIIALDDFGTGYSSFDRLALIQPDIVKIDRTIISNIQNNFIHSEILNAIANMCHKIGALVISEGVEHSDEILSCMKKDIDIFQGFWFLRPKNDIKGITIEQIHERIDKIGGEYKSLVKNHMFEKKSLIDKSEHMIQKFISLFERYKFDCFNKLYHMISMDNQLEAIYLLDEANGKQVGETIIKSGDKALYRPSKDGQDHSFKEYFFLAKESLRGDYLSGKYISKASGNICRTYAVKIVIDDFKYIMCSDIVV